MPKNTGRTQNINDTADVQPIHTVATDVAEVLIAANTDRIYVAISVLTRSVFVRLQPAADDAAVRKGIHLSVGETYELPSDNLYLGEISVINVKNGQAPEIYTTEY